MGSAIISMAINKESSFFIEVSSVSNLFTYSDGRAAALVPAPREKGEIFRSGREKARRPGAEAGKP